VFARSCALCHRPIKLGLPLTELPTAQIPDEIAMPFTPTRNISVTAIVCACCVRDCNATFAKARVQEASAS
jgi:hypothetical protein